MNNQSAQAVRQSYGHQLGASLQQSGQTGSPVARLTQIAEQQGNLTHARERLDKAAQALIDRIMPILEQGKETSPMPATPPDVMLVPVAEQLREHAKGIHRTAEMLENVMGRIEL